MQIGERIIARVTRRSPDFVIGEGDVPYLLRWWILPRNRFFNVYMHCFLRSDDDRARHTHPWLFNLSWLLRNGYREWIADSVFIDRVAPAAKLRIGAAAHRIELTNGPCWTLFVTGPRVREWGFLCPQGFVHWKKFTARDNAGHVGQGCAE